MSLMFQILKNMKKRFQNNSLCSDRANEKTTILMNGKTL